MNKIGLGQRGQKKLMAVVITTYNNPKSLELCLLSFQNQTFQNFEIFIADDGSQDETRDLLQRMKREMPVQMYHVWHPDQGYRKSKINNNVLRQINPERFEVLIFVDHDVVLHHRFVEDHYLAHAKCNFAPLLWMGRRVDLSPELTEKITPQNVKHFNLGLNWPLLQSSFRGQTKNVLRSVRLDLPKGLSHLLKRDRVFDLLGSNFSVSTRIMFQVNGYNEDFKSYWGEDGDLFVRIRNSGVKVDGRIGYAVQWHLFHKRLEETPAHIEQYQALLDNREYRECKNGIRKIGESQ